MYISRLWIYFKQLSGHLCVILTVSMFVHEFFLVFSKSYKKLFIESEIQNKNNPDENPDLSIDYTKSRYQLEV